MGRYDFSKPRFEMLAKNMPFHALLDAVGAGAEAEKKQAKPDKRGESMDYRVTFMDVEVKAESESEAEQEACRIIAEDPGFYVKGAEVIEDDESWVSA